ncbi:very-long-chain 3-oxoacyl-CoA reductase-like [Antedon mediterranea]|uniref:very-long-chain 3-oxoacyl-CoA reductase-like n=1 Tax=Antedon mediterranea TaxID=105859 RepID=UPI003AF8D32E
MFIELNQAFAALGAVTASYLAFKILLSIIRALKAYFFSRSLGLNTNLAKLGKWAVVTGATDGIGKAYAEQLAKMGLNMVLISRTMSKLEETASEIVSRYKVQTRVIAVDFCKGPEIYGDIETQLDGLEIGVLVNNVGMSYPFPNYFLELENVKQKIVDMLNCNCLSMSMMIAICLPQMETRRKGAIINVSSASGLSTCPLLALYSATKAYVNFLSQCLHYEYQDKGIVVQCVAPYFVTTKLSKIKKKSWTIPSPDTYVSSALGTVGVESLTMGCTSHALQKYVLECLPESMVTKNTMGILKSTRARALKKQAKTN